MTALVCHVVRDVDAVTCERHVVCHVIRDGTHVDSDTPPPLIAHVVVDGLFTHSAGTGGSAVAADSRVVSRVIPFLSTTQRCQQIRSPITVTASETPASCEDGVSLTTPRTPVSPLSRPVCCHGRASRGAVVTEGKALAGCSASSHNNVRGSD